MPVLHKSDPDPEGAVRVTDSHGIVFEKLYGMRTMRAILPKRGPVLKRKKRESFEVFQARARTALAKIQGY